ncbi:MAG TPA: alpha-hydroxy acid oxidase [Candidatus Limnocylindrales bacterium]|nr:alpha-hydroxy acid oxidase [Candidatus Limnocylindrales bacterium]
MTTEPTIDLSRLVSLADFEAIAAERMEAAAYGYVAGGAWDEITLVESVEAWRRYRLRPRMLRDLRSVDVSGTFFGRRTALPVAVAPMAVQGLAHPDGEVAMARGAVAAGIPYCLSTSASRSIEEVGAAVGRGEWWFQPYLVKDLDFTRSLVERAAASGARAIALTVDLPVLGYRERDRRTGFTMPAMANIAEAEGAARGRYGAIEGQRAIGLTWADIATIRSWTDLPLAIKGLLTAEDAHLAIDEGAVAVVISNHGARQLDRVPATADVLEEIAVAVDGRAEVWVDGGIRRGIDILIARALGATGVLVGRPFFYALAVGGSAGVERAAAILSEELELALPLLGVASFQEIDRSHVR